MTTLPSLLSRPPPFILLQSSASRSALPILRWTLASHSARGNLILLSVLYPPATLLPSIKTKSTGALTVFDWTECIPGYDPEGSSYETKIEQIYNAIEQSPPGPLTFVLDSADTLLGDLESIGTTYSILHRLTKLLSARKDPSCLVIHVTTSSPVLFHLVSTSFSPSLLHLHALPPVLLTYIATAFLTIPPHDPSTNAGTEKFWSLFIPMSARSDEVDALVYGKSGEGGAGGCPTDEFVVDVVVRGRSVSSGKESGGKRRPVERYLEGWNPSKGGPCLLTDLEELKTIWGRSNVRDERTKGPPDPTQNLSFNLNLTSAQQESKASVPLPYTKIAESDEAPRVGQILYDPDSADDIDEEDPDEDLDI